MPELPEVETMCRGIRGVVGQIIRGASFPRQTRRPILTSPPTGHLTKRLVGSRIDAVERAGKRAILRLAGAAADEPERLVIEPRMTGLLLRVPAPSDVHIRMVLNFADYPPLTFWDRRGLGTIRLLDNEEFSRRCGPTVLGPDALTLTGAAFYSAIHYSRRPIKQALLDQQVTAGIGNIYAAEILFAAGLDPRSRCCRISRAECDAIAKSARQILRRRRSIHQYLDHVPNWYRQSPVTTGAMERLHNTVPAFSNTISSGAAAGRSTWCISAAGCPA